ncbi:MAG: 3-dehydroquinate dehydratase [Saprospiraceae bacterium]|jgi:3-dehydroquinate dehydratase-2|nr:3-dehydroquinate dehydratase [Saprospiraceae bacterium]
MKVLILNGPNLNLTGTRDPDIYGTTSFESFIPALQKKFPDHTIEYRQSNHEGELIDWLQSVQSQGFQAVVFNPGAYAHTSYALADTLSSAMYPVIEVHISNIQAREKFRHRSLTGAHCKGMISGLGLTGYTLAVAALTEV